jgi:hypothetical protein
MSADDKTKDGASNAGSLLDSVLGKLSTLAEQVAEIARLQQDQQTALQRLESQKSGTSTFSKGFVGFATKQPDSQPVPRQHKQDFPKFDGKSDPLTFIHHREVFFRGYRILEEEKVWMASIHLLDAAQIWYMHVEADQGTPTWNRFVSQSY